MRTVENKWPEEHPEIRRLAGSYFREPASRAVCVSLGRGRLEIWRSPRRRAHKSAVYYVGDDGTHFRVNGSLGQFTRMLKSSRPDLSDVEFLVKLISLGPGRRIVLVDDSYGFTPPVETWAPVRREDGGWEVCCLVATKGRWERMVIGGDYSISVEDLGPAPPLSFR